MKLLSTKEAAAIITERTGKPISPRQVRNEIVNKKLAGIKVGHDYIIEESALDNYVRRHPGKQSTHEE